MSVGGAQNPVTRKLPITSRVWQALWRFWATDQGLSFFLVLLILGAFVLPPLVAAWPFGGLVADIGFSLLLVAGAAALSERRWTLVAVSMIVTAALLVRWTTHLAPSAELGVWNAVSSLVTLGLFAVVVLGQVFRRGPVSGHRILGAIAVYLLLGMIWANAYELVALLHPGAFSGAVESGGVASAFMYYSFVTLTTMGYGDILPVHPIARSLAISEALTGQLYLAILIARLVSQGLQSRGEDG